MRVISDYVCNMRTQMKIGGEQNRRFKLRVQKKASDSGAIICPNRAENNRR